MSHFEHERALCESPHVGDGTRIWAFAHVLPDARIGSDCNICDGVFVENDVRIGDRVTIKCGVQVWDGVTLEDDVFVGPNATFTNDRFPRSGQQQEQVARTVVRRGASLGANCTILANIEIGERAMIGAGAVVTRSVPRGALVVGNPARIVGYVDEQTGQTVRPAEPIGADASAAEAVNGAQVYPTGVENVTFHRFPVVRDLRGSLTVGEFDGVIPFVPHRYFMVFDVPGAEVRGEHAHRVCHQFVMCARGEVSVIADDGVNREEFLLRDNATGIYLPPMTWGIQYRYSPDSVLLVFASHAYDASDYIRDYDEFCELRRAASLTPA